MKKTKTHYHTFADHPNPEKRTHVACTEPGCGFAIPREHLAYALEHGATFKPKEETAKAAPDSRR